MALRDDLLNPVPGENPCGENLRYQPVYDKIKEARREEDDAPQGEWQRERKTADYTLVIKLAGEALATRSKDLQLAAWLAEAVLRQEGFAGLRAALDLIRALLETWWDNLYPELEDGEADLRAAPLDWLGSRMDAALRSQPVAKGRVSWYKFRESRGVGLETDADTEAKQEARAAAIADGKMTGEDWDQAFSGTPKSFYAGLEETLDGLLESIEALGGVCEEKFTDAAPSFAPMRATVEEIRHSVHGLLQNKREAEPDEVGEAAPEEPEEPAWAGAEEPPERPDAGRPTARRRPHATLSAEPSDREDACRRVAAVASYLRGQDPNDPVPYLLLRALRFGELRAPGSDLDPNLLEPPATPLRQQLRKAANEGEWQQVQDAAESAAAAPCGRGWLDLQRYAWRSACELGQYQVQAAIRAEVNGLLADYPGLRQAVLLDDTPAANPETQAWLDEIAPPPAAPPEPVFQSRVADPEPESPEWGEHPPSASDLAREAALGGRPQEAIEILTRESAAERSGRGRFQRRLELAELCMAIGYERIAQPILEQLAAEIDARGLEGWEDSATVATPLALLYRCLVKAGAAAETKQKVYDRICRLDPLQAMTCVR